MQGWNKSGVRVGVDVSVRESKFEVRRLRENKEANM